MSDFLREFMKDEIDAAVNQAKLDEREQTIKRMVKQLMKNTGLNADEAMNAMGIPQAEQEKYISLL